MDTLGTLQFDAKKVNTDLAMKYLDENKDFHPILNDYKSPDLYICSQNVVDGNSFKLFSVPISGEELKWSVWNFERKIDSSLTLTKILRKLSKLIEKNAELFAQLEFVTRKIPLDDTKSQIWLIAQNLLCCGKEENWRLDDSTEDDLYYYVLPMAADAPLLCLGCVAQVAEEKACLLIAATKKTAIVCHLFTKLCREVGLNEINFVLIEDITQNLHPGIPKVDIDMMGSTGVITENSDLDSAVDVFLSSTTMSPWRLRRILVQECIYDAFKETVEWKCGLKTTKLTPQSLALQKLCTNIVAYDEKVLLLDYAGPEDDVTSESQYIFVEAYRTTKELISLLNVYNVKYLSVWSNHLSEANEIAFNTAVPIVWINDFGKFQGPPKVSQAIYSRICMIKQNASNVYNYDIVKAHNSWISLPLEQRRQIMLVTLEKIFLQHEGSGNSTSLLNLHSALINWHSDQTVDVSKDKMCVCIDVPIGVVKSERFMDNVPFLRSLVSGNAVIFNDLVLDEDFNFCSVIKAFQATGVPVAVESDFAETDLNKKNICDQKFVTRVIWTNFGTIFAN